MSCTAAAGPRPVNNPESLGITPLSVVVISPDESRRKSLVAALAGPHANVVQQIAHYPGLDAIPESIDQACDVVLLDLDHDPERALDLVERISSHRESVTVMVHSAKTDPDLLLRSMRVGAREFLPGPVLPSVVAEAFVRTSSRRQESRRNKKPAGRLLVFTGAKGGVGVTTIASSFAVALAKESAAKVVLVDLDIQLGDAALGLGLNARFSVVDALSNTSRLDAEFVSTLLVKHASGLFVLAAPDDCNASNCLKDGAGKLMQILRDEFAYVVIDSGPNPCNGRTSLWELADSIYLVTQASLPALRNSHRLIATLSTPDRERRLELVLNRFDSRTVEIDPTSITKALTQPAKWKIPNEYVVAKRAQNAGVPLTAEETPISRVLFQMARAACGKAAHAEKKKKFGLFG